ncbi:MAG: hypothetical protein IH849_05860 [Acidobacteria bacterium]|nr:hypothetical protein [Acidobacteriota bacterium]
MTTIELKPLGKAGRLFWTTAQLLGLVTMAVFIIGFFARPDTALNVLWNAAIPLLPATFLINPALWRNSCPLAKLNMLPNRFAGRRVATRHITHAAGAVGIVLFVVMVPARRFLFNTDGVALGVTVILIAVAALLLGTLFDAKAGFCNTFCPVLPVERLYGQRPLVDIGNAHCSICTLCTKTACIDLAPTKSVALTLGRSNGAHAWLHTVYGVFAASFPGFVVGYNLTPDGPLSTAGAVYLQVAAWSAGSFVVTYLVVRGVGLSAEVTTLTLAGTALALYYWYAAPVLTTAYRLPVEGTTAIRGAAFVLIAVWSWRALAQRSANGRQVTEPTS